MLMLAFPMAALKNAPEVWRLLGIPDDHYVGVIIGFGYPLIRYMRGAQRHVDPSRVTRPKF